jgi:hypothetical protein
MTSIITFGSRPAFTPITTASEVIATAAADRMLFASFMVCAWPGFSPRKKVLPKCCSIGCSVS